MHGVKVSTHNSVGMGLKHNSVDMGLKHNSVGMGLMEALHTHLSNMANDFANSINQDGDNEGVHHGDGTQ